jgi:hypothetical protein
MIVNCPATISVISPLLVTTDNNRGILAGSFKLLGDETAEGSRGAIKAAARRGVRYR